MHDFAKLLINGDLMLHTDLADSIQFFAIRGYDGVICELNLPIEADFDTPDTCFKLYQGYHMIMTSHESMDKPAQHLLNTYLDAINNEMKLGAANMDTLVKDHLLDGIDRVNAAGKLNQLRIKQGVDPELIGFYEKLNDYVKVLAKQLAGPAPFAMPDVKPVKQEAPRRKI